MRKWSHSKALYLVSGLALLLTLVAWFFLARSLRMHEEARFEALVSQMRVDLSHRMQTYTNALVQARGAFHLNPRLGAKQFRQYVHDMRLIELYPGIRAIGFGTWINGRELPHYAKSFDYKSWGMTDYQIWPEPKGQSEFVVVSHLSPLDDKNSNTIGYDMYSEPVRRAAMESARDSGALTSTGAIVLSPRPGANPPRMGFIIYLPVYQFGEIPPTVAERRQLLRGFLYAPFQLDNLFQALFGSLSAPHPTSIKVHFIQPDGQRQLVFARGNPDSRAWARTVTLDLGGKTWEMEVTTTKEFLGPSSRYLPYLILVAGSFLTLLTLWLLRFHFQQSQAEKERHLQMETLNRTGSFLSGELEMERLVQSVIDTGKEISKAQFGAFFYQVTDPKGSRFQLYTLSGAERKSFEKFPMPRNTEVFRPTFEGASVVRSPDITQDSRYGKNAPFQGMPPGHLPVRSYLAVPVASRSGAVIGGLFFGHELPGIFGAQEERLIKGLAGQAAVAMDNAKLYRSAQEAIRVRDEFLSIASHELKTPLTPLKLQVQNLTRNLRRGEALKPEMLEGIAVNADRQINRLSRLVEDLLDVSRISAGLLRLNREDLDLRTLVRETVERFQPQLQAAHNTLELELPESLPGSFDRLRMEQVVANLVTNAIRYAPGTRLRMDLKERKGQACLLVEDEGPGIPTESRELIFSKFERISPASGNTGGLGLGLYITRQIIEAHGGTIQAAEIPKGARFEITLPLRPTASPEPETQQPSAAV